MSSVYGQPDGQGSRSSPGAPHGPGGYYYPPGGQHGPGYPGGAWSQPPRPPRRPRHRLLAAVAATAVAFGAGAGLTAVATGAGGSLGGVLGGHQLSTASIVRMTDPAVVDIVSTLGTAGAEAAGTGMVLTSSGEVLTNNHVVDGATAIQVTDVGNGQTYRASVTGYDATHDIAVLKLAGASGLKTAKIGDSDSVGVGQKVVALGNAGGKGGLPSVAEGQVTGLDRSITATDQGSGTSERLTGVIETNADIQPGDSGGPLLNTSGQVIGMDTAAGQQPDGLGGQSQPQAFAIPIDQAIATAKQIESGTSSQTVHIGATAFLGVAIVPDGSPGQGGGVAGAQVDHAVSGGAAQRAGIAGGDVITAVGGHAVTSSSSLRDVITSYHPGDRVTVTWTDQSGQQHSARVTLSGGGPVG